MKNCIVFCSLLVTIVATSCHADSLPGARPVIDAANFNSLQAALDAIPKEGGLVRLPAGNFEISEPLKLQRGDVRIEGAGSATNIINTNTDGKSALIVEHADGAKVKKGERLWRVNLSNFRITGNEKSGHGIEAIQIEEIFIQGVSVSYNGADGIHLDRGVMIENTYGSVLSGNMIEECVGTAVTLDRDCYGITISANVIAHNGAGVDLQDAHGCAVSANTFTIMKDFGMRIGEGSGRITVTGNNFCNSYTGDGQVHRKEDDRQAGGLVLRSTTAISVTENIFAGLSTKAVTEEGTVTKVVTVGNGAVDTEDDRP